MSTTLVSMTGHGDAVIQEGPLSVSVELRSVNHRHFKLLIRSAEVTPALESRIESLVREVVQRGSVSVALRVQRSAGDDRYRIHLPALRGYCQQLAAEFGEDRVLSSALGALLALPGVVDDASLAAQIREEEWPAVERAVLAALERLQGMRVAEGVHMAHDLAGHCHETLHALDFLATRAPFVVDGYRRRIQDRVQRILDDQNLTLAPGDLARELAILADRCDISEELVRLRSHTQQFLATTQGPGANGRKLDFLIQEMFRETNTIGAKGNDVEIAQAVVELKNRIEKMREMVQNIE